MCQQSSVSVVDVLKKNETDVKDMLDIMETLHGYLGEDYPVDHRVQSLQEIMEPWDSLRQVDCRERDPKKDVNVTVDFLETVVVGHLLASLTPCTILNINRVFQYPKQFPASLKTLKTAAESEKTAFIFDLARQVVDKCTTNKAALTFQPQSQTQDHVYSYAQLLCHFGSLVMLFRDAWAEGDGDQIMMYWKVFMLHFYDSSTRSKHAVESVRLLLHYLLGYDMTWCGIGL